MPAEDVLVLLILVGGTGDVKPASRLLYLKRPTTSELPLLFILFYYYNIFIGVMVSRLFLFSFATLSRHDQRRGNAIRASVGALRVSKSGLGLPRAPGGV